MRALGRIGDSRGAARHWRSCSDRPVASGRAVVYDALVAFGPAAEPVFADALGSEIESVRVASCFGVAALSEPERRVGCSSRCSATARRPVRSAAARVAGQVGGELLPDALAHATRDEQATVRSAATGALGSYDDPRGVELAVNALLDPDRDTAVRAGESLVRLSRGPLAGEAAGRGAAARRATRGRSSAR